MSFLILLAACQKPGDAGNKGDGTPPDPDTDTTSSPTDSWQVIDTEVTVTDSATTTEPKIDCTALSLQPLSLRELDRPRGHHGLAFDLDGNLIGLDNDNLIKVAFDDTFVPWALDIGTTEQMDWIGDGDLAVAVYSSNAIIRVTPAGVASPITTDVGAYGVTVGPDGKIWTGNNDILQRIHPTTGVKEQLFADQAGWSPRVVQFSPDLTKLYIGNFGGGEIYVVDLDANYDPIGVPTLFASGVGQGPYMDCLTVDACGNLYVCDYSDRMLFRISPTGQVGEYVDWNPISKYGHGVAYGSGIGGWLDTAIYLPQPYDSDTVVEVDLGVVSGESLWPPIPVL